jgi:hypothetical protein
MISFDWCPSCDVITVAVSLPPTQSMRVQFPHVAPGTRRDTPRNPACVPTRRGREVADPSFHQLDLSGCWEFTLPLVARVPGSAWKTFWMALKDAHGQHGGRRVSSYALVAEWQTRTPQERVPCV